MLILTTLLHVFLLSSLSAAIVGEETLNNLPKIKLSPENTILIDGYLAKKEKNKIDKVNRKSVKLNLICDKHYKHLESHYRCQAIKVEDL
jgi:hypothetical protein